jgi:hypothetical protein
MPPPRREIGQPSYDCVEKDTTYDIHKSQAADHFSAMH